MRKVSNYFFVILLFFSVLTVAQENRYTKGAENGYSWKAMSNPLRIYDDSKYNYLSEILERYRLLQQNFPEVEHLGCSEELNDLLKAGESENISLEDMVKAIDEFYTSTENVSIPIIFAYCFRIKELSGKSDEELIMYLNEVIEFCRD
ncbi:MAG: hypothetical protein KJN64_04235 [Ignavibacteria bacterium]|nr:hypothetical protein [Ignavibacteria bacterium]MBT8381158.1 hypothetical protein [Ignavibacteria bacterium]MBT8390411.1 hypothetical protein [Ignavibacteria bacterium]NNJ52601.1 hypothetical protein [Ignavibacteriaceae bacterium]NNL21656.1 hypothetical protein [Ignavibacteriaceae bacterium]